MKADYHIDGDVSNNHPANIQIVDIQVNASKDATQQECRTAWILLKAEMRERIHRINMETPANPSTEPDWWCEMMDVFRLISQP